MTNLPRDNAELIAHEDAKLIAYLRRQGGQCNRQQPIVPVAGSELLKAADRLESLSPQPPAETGDDDAELRIVFDGPPSHESGRFVECETADGRSVNAGQWHERPDGLWELRIASRLSVSTGDDELVARLLDQIERTKHSQACWGYGDSALGKLVRENSDVLLNRLEALSHKGRGE